MRIRSDAPCHEPFPSDEATGPDHLVDRWQLARGMMRADERVSRRLGAQQLGALRGRGWRARIAPRHVIRRTRTIERLFDRSNGRSIARVQWIT